METSTVYLKYTCPLLGLFPKDSESTYHINTCVSIFIIVLFTTASLRTQPLEYMHNGDLFIQPQRGVDLCHLLGNGYIAWSELGQMQKENFTFSFNFDSQNSLLAHMTWELKVHDGKEEGDQREGGGGGEYGQSM